MSYSTVKSPKLAHGRFSNLSWLENRLGQRITPKFKVKDEVRRDGFICYNTTAGNFVCHVMQPDIVYQDSSPRLEIFITKLDEHLYKLEYNLYGWHAILFTDGGAKITSEYSDVHKMSCGLMRTDKGEYVGFIDGDANVVIPFKYKSAGDFDEFGHAIVVTEDGKSTVIDTKGNELFDPMDVYRLEHMSENLFKLHARKGGIGVIDITGKEIIPAVYNEVWLRSGHIMVKYHGKFGLFTVTGETEFECMYPEIIETPDKFVVQDFAKIEIEKHKEVQKHT